MTQRVLLVDTCMNNSPGMCTTPYAGLGYIAETLEVNGIEYDVALYYRHGEKGIIKKAKQLSPDVIGISMLSMSYHRKYALISRLRRVCPDATIVIGGSHVYAFPNTLAGCPESDCAIEGDGEIPFLLLVNGFSPNNIPGLIYRNNGSIKSNPAFYSSHSDINAYPFPKYKRFNLIKYPIKRINIVTSRGCLYKCAFCTESRVFGRRYVTRNPDSVIEELTYWYGEGYRYFDFADSILAGDRKRLMEICQKIIDNKMTDMLLTCENGLRGDQVDRDLIVQMRRAGFKSMGMGLESTSDTVLQTINKGEDFATIEKAVKIATEEGMLVGLYTQIGLPGERAADVRKAFQFVQKYPLFSVHFFVPVPMPGTKLYEYTVKNNVLNQAEEDYLGYYILHYGDPIFETPEMSVREQKDLMKQADILTLKVRTRCLVQNLPKALAFYKVAYVISLVNRWILTGKNNWLRNLARRFLRPIIGDIFLNPF